MQRLDVSVVIVTRNTRELTLAAVQSVLDQSTPPRFEIVVVDNGSTDGTVETVRRLGSAVKVLSSPVNLGFAKANNLGASESRGVYLLLLNSDARLKPGVLIDAVQLLESHPDWGILGGQLLNPDGSRQNSIANFPSLATELVNKSLLRRLFPKRYPGKERHYDGPVAVESVVGAFMLIRRELWDRLGGLDERYFFFLEETDFCLRAVRQGWKVMHVPSIEVWHEQGRSAGQASSASRIEYWRSRYTYFTRHRGPWVCRILRAGLLVRLGIDGLANGLITLVTFGKSARPAERFRHCAALWIWHLRGCPDDMGLPR